MPCPSHPPLLHHSNYVWRRVEVMKLLFMQFSPISCHFVSRNKWFPAKETKVGDIISRLWSPSNLTKRRINGENWKYKRLHIHTYILACPCGKVSTAVSDNILVGGSGYLHLTSLGPCTQTNVISVTNYCEADPTNKALFPHYNGLSLELHIQQKAGRTQTHKYIQVTKFSPPKN
jgi:hypothetical protein